MVNKSTIYRGDTFKGVINLRLKDSCDESKVNPFVIEAGSTVEIRFPGQTATVVLSTSTPGEVTIVDASLSTIAFEGSPAKSTLLKKIADAAITVVVTQGVSGEIFTFEKTKYLTIKDRSN
jgi:hypothetical protein